MKRSTTTRGTQPARSAVSRRGPRVRRLRGFVAVIFAGALLGVGGSATAGAATLAPPFPFPTLATTCSTAYLDGDIRLGPAQFQQLGMVAPMLFGYNRLAGLTAAQFIATYWDPTANGWRYPPDNGYLLVFGHPVEYTGTISAGEKIDRFGSEFGAFLAPEDTPYAQRSLPPMSLDDFDPSYTCNYHLYTVIKPFKADEGPIAPGFGQPGFGLQIQLDASLVPGAPSPLNVMWLINNGYLARSN
jgi:hypothetical protein